MKKMKYKPYLKKTCCSPAMMALSFSLVLVRAQTKGTANGMVTNLDDEKADAELRLGNETPTLTIVNEVRNRVSVDPKISLTLEDVLEKRMLGLSWETWTRNDQVRFGSFTKAILDKPQSDPYRVVYPIPADVLPDNMNLTQNPGYAKG